jgi:nucleoside 2-deoxyribosyltransferase
LSLKGWEKYEQLKRGQNNSHKAFMAMQYDNKELTELFEKTIKPELKELGFEINRLDKTKKSGLIDENLRVEIRDSKFLVVDLSDGNKGAYWEAGYGEGLGKKIFYICDKQKYEKFKNRKKKLVHFDVEHQNIYFWNDNDTENPNKFIDSLKAGIRLAFPKFNKH